MIARYARVSTTEQNLDMQRDCAFGRFAEFERNLIRERTYAGLAAARARGRKGGRRKKLGDKHSDVAVDLYRQKKHTIDEICKAKLDSS